MSKIQNQETFQFYLNQLSNYPILSQEEELELAIRKDNGDIEARNLLINSNQRYVVSVVNQFKDNTDIDILDLIMAGNEGLTHAVDKYDYRTGKRLLTYATAWIRKRIYEELAKYNKFHNYITYTYDEEGNRVETNNFILSLDNQLNDDSKATLLDTLADDSLPSDRIYAEEMTISCNKALETLSKEEQFIFINKANGTLNVREICEKLSLSPAVVNRIYKQTIEKLLSNKLIIQSFNNLQHSYSY